MKIFLDIFLDILERFEKAFDYYGEHRVAVTLGGILLFILCPPLQAPLLALMVITPAILLVVWVSGWILGPAGAGFVAVVLFTLEALVLLKAVYMELFAFFERFL